MNMVNKIINSPVIHPFLLAVFPPLFLVSHNIEQLTKNDIVSVMIVIAVIVCAAALIWLLLSFIIKDRKKASLIVSLGIILFFSYGHFISLIEGFWKDIHIGEYVIGYHKTFLTIWGIIFLVGAYFIWRTRKNLGIPTGLLNVVSTTLVLITLINIGAYGLSNNSFRQDNTITENGSGIPDINGSGTSPDIYYIVLDMYASSNTLQEIYNYDNFEFTNYLIDKGFFIAFESHSNYQYTHCSLASSLNMEFLNSLTSATAAEINTSTTFEMTKNNKVIAFLKSRGYHTINVCSEWAATQYNPYADENIKRNGRYNEYLNIFIQTTMAGPFMKFELKEDRAKTILFTFSELAKLPENTSPKFVFAHIVCPHPPYVFDADGKPVPESSASLAEDRDTTKLYVHQLIFTNKKVKELLNEILAKSETPPIIIIQADHSTSTTFPHERGKVQYISSPSQEMLRERFGILNAYYLPGNGDELLYNSITPVNTFRVIFNYYFGTNYELLPDRCYYSTNDNPYEFTDVTDRIINQN